MLWLLALLPVLSGVAIYATGERRRNRLAVAAALALAATVLLALLAAWLDWRGALAWSAALPLRAALTPRSAVMAVLVPAVALPVLVYAAAHRVGDGRSRLVALLLVFVGAMELLVVASDLITLLVAWELVGACSWALIGHHWRDRDNPAAGRYAFVATRIGDLGLFLAAMSAFAGTGSFAYAELDALEGPLLHLFAAGVLLSAAAKSGQVPFAPWLFRAMAGPSPVSALLHAATMVAAGAYLLIRLQPLLAAVDWFAAAAVGIGLTTALSGGFVALLQGHAKKLLAASTSAHYGLMFVAVGAGYPGVALLHLVAHAGFKALLFLAAGFAGERAGSFELARMGLGRQLPMLAACSAAGSLALAGVPPLGGGWTKDAIVTAAGHVDGLVAVAVIAAGGLSAAYAARFQLLAFAVAGHGKSSGESPWRGAMLAVLALALATLLLSALWWPGVRDGVAAILQVDLPEAARWEYVASLLAVLAGLYAGWLSCCAARNPGGSVIAIGLGEWLGLPAAIEAVVTRPVSTLAAAASRADDTVVDALPRGVAAAGCRIAAVFGRFGEWIADLLPEGSAGFIDAGAADTRRLQTGLSHHYYALLAAVTLVLLGILLLWN